MTTAFPDDSYHWFRKLYLKKRISENPPPPPTCCSMNKTNECISSYKAEFRDELWDEVINTQTFLDACRHMYQSIQDKLKELEQYPEGYCFSSKDTLKLTGFIDCPHQIDEVLPKTFIRGFFYNNVSIEFFPSSLPTSDKYITNRVNIRLFFYIYPHSNYVDFITRDLELNKTTLEYVISLAQPEQCGDNHQLESHPANKTTPDVAEYYPPPPSAPI